MTASSGSGECPRVRVVFCTGGNYTKPRGLSRREERCKGSLSSWLHARAKSPAAGDHHLLNDARFNLQANNWRVRCVPPCETGLGSVSFPNDTAKPRFPTQTTNHNRAHFSKAGANSEKRGNTVKWRCAVGQTQKCLLIFFQRGQICPPCDRRQWRFLKRYLAKSNNPENL